MTRKRLLAGSEFLIRRASGARLGSLTVMKGGGGGGGNQEIGSRRDGNEGRTGEEVFHFVFVIRGGLRDRSCVRKGRAPCCWGYGEEHDDEDGGDKEISEQGRGQ